MLVMFYWNWVPLGVLYFVMKSDELEFSPVRSSRCRWTFERETFTRRAGQQSRSDSRSSGTDPSTPSSSGSAVRGVTTTARARSCPGIGSSTSNPSSACCAASRFQCWLPSANASCRITDIFAPDFPTWPSGILKTGWSHCWSLICFCCLPSSSPHHWWLLKHFGSLKIKKRTIAYLKCLFKWPTFFCCRFFTWFTAVDVTVTDFFGNRLGGSWKSKDPTTDYRPNKSCGLTFWLPTASRPKSVTLKVGHLYFRW